jgi:hypothetical protein
VYEKDPITKISVESNTLVLHSVHCLRHTTIWSAQSKARTKHGNACAVANAPKVTNLKSKYNLTVSNGGIEKNLDCNVDEQNLVEPTYH